jgi:hypothetical protein
MNGSYDSNVYIVSNVVGATFSSCNSHYSIAGRAFEINGQSIILQGCEIQSNYLGGVNITSTTKNITLKGNHILRNNISNNASESGVRVSGAIVKFTIEGNQITNDAAAIPGTDAPGYQRYGIDIGAGADHFIITGNNLEGNVTGGLNDGSGGSTKVIANNLP